MHAIHFTITISHAGPVSHVQQYTATESGLPSNMVYAVHADTLTGLLWVCTSNGIAAFDGSDMTHPVTSIPGYDCISSFVDNGGRLIVCTYDGRMVALNTRLYAGVVAWQPFGLNDNEFPIYSYQDTSGRLQILSSRNSQFEWGISGPRNGFQSKTTIIDWLIRATTSLSRYENATHFPSYSTAQLRQASSLYIDRREYRVLNNTFIVMKNRLLARMPSGLKCILDGESLGLKGFISGVAFSGNDLWVAIYGSGGYRVTDWQQPSAQATLIRPDADITGVAIDATGTVWWSSLSQGICRMAGPVANEETPDLPPIATLYPNAWDRAQLFATTTTGGLYLHEGGQWTRLIPGDLVQRKSRMLFAKGIAYYISDKQIYRIDKPYRHAQRISPDSTIPLALRNWKKMFVPPGSSHAIAHTYMIVRALTLPDLQMHAHPLGHNILAASALDTNRLLALVQNGGGIADLRQNTFTALQTPLRGAQNLLHYLGYHYLAYRTDDATITDTALRVVWSMDLPRRLGVKEIKEVAVADSAIFLLTDKGVVRANPQSRQLSVVAPLSQPVTNYYSLAISQGRVWLSGAAGLTSFSVSNPVAKKNEKIHIAGLSINNKGYAAGNEAAVFSGAGLRRIGCAVFFPGTQPGALLREYALYAPDEKPDWTPFNGHDIRVTAPGPGTYTLAVRQINLLSGDTVLGGRGIHLLPRWHERWWVRGAGLATVSVLAFWMIYAVAQYRLRLRYGNERRRQLLLQYKSAALLAQLNPHFVFNALNPLQAFILSGDKPAALGYLARFSNLMRRMLATSRLEQQSLREELTFIEEYLAVQALRYPGRFTWEITVSPHLDPENTVVPAMLIQPLVENAIEHGLPPADQPGLIRIVAWQWGRDLRISVSDNGPGIPAASTLRDGHALHILQDRLVLLRRDRKPPLNMISEGGAGCKVTILIPLRLHGPLANA